MSPPLVLASASPRRRALLAGAGIRCTVRPAAVEERQRPGEAPEAMATRLATAKAAAVAEALEAAASAEAVLGADTCVVLGEEVLGKPTGEADAARMLAALSGREHRVLTGFAIATPGGGVPSARVVETAVRFKRLHPAEVRRYLALGEWKDKAGGYAVQGAAAYMIRAIRGSYTNVVGLPLCEVVEALVAAGIDPWA